MFRIIATALLLASSNGFQQPAPAARTSTALKVTFNGANGVNNGFSTGNAGFNVNNLFPMQQGSSVAIVTPMKQNGSVDLPALKKLLEWHVAEGTDNLCILGTTGEANTLSTQERKDVLTTAVNVCKGKIPILAGCGTIDPAHVKEMTQMAIDLGCDASLIVTPYYVKPPQRGLIKHFVDTANLGLPVVVYNVPGRTAVNLSDESMAILAQHDNIVGLKDATGDLKRLENLKQELQKLHVPRDSILLYSGDDATSKDFVLAGGDGCISVTANVAPAQMHQLMQACLEGNEELATKIDDSIAILHKKLFVEANPIPAKWAVHRCGHIETAVCRPPLDALDEKYHADVEQALKEAGFLPQLMEN